MPTKYELSRSEGSTAVKARGCDGIPIELFKANRRCHRGAAFNMSANLKNPAVATGKRSIFIPVSKNGRMCNWTVALISHGSNVMLKVLHAKLQHHVSQELAVVQAGFRKEETDQIANICWIIEKAKEF